MKQVTTEHDIDRFLKMLDPSLLGRSGSIFYSGRSAFVGQRDLYILGLNPGGCPIKQAGETIEIDLQKFRNRTEPWSAYEHECWRGKAAGTYGIQPRILHLLRGLNRSAGETPASNVIFARTSSEAKLTHEKKELLEQCWPVHQAVINQLGVKVVLCLGNTAGAWVREQLGATVKVDSYTEKNNRKWRSTCYATGNNIRVVTVTHPGRANWCNSLSDPTPLVKRALAAVSTSP